MHGDARGIHIFPENTPVAYGNVADTELIRSLFQAWARSGPQGPLFMVVRVCEELALIVKEHAKLCEFMASTPVELMGESEQTEFQYLIRRPLKTYRPANTPEIFQMP